MKENRKMKNLLLTLLLTGLTVGVSGCNGNSSNSTLAERSMSKENGLLTTVNHDFRGNVVIIGAGAAGLAAANQLERNGVEYTILEATDHYGGRIQKNTSFADFPIDIGAEWIHADKSTLNTLLNLDGDNPKQQVIPYAPLDVYFLSKAGSVEKVPESQLREQYDSNPEYKFKNTTWFDYLEQNFLHQVENRIVYNSPVVSVDYSGDKVEVKTKSGEIYTADKVISTVSIAVLQRELIKFTPAFSSQKKKALQSVKFYPGFKLFMKFSEDFYPDIIGTETETGEKTFYNVAYKKEAKDHVFGLLSTGNTAIEYYNLGSNQKIVTEVLAELDALYDGAASQFYTGEYLIKDWGGQKYTLGTWTSDYDQEEVEALNSNLKNKVYFAGETHDASGFVSTVHGAILSGYTVVNQLLTE